MQTQTITIDDCRFEILRDGDEFLGLGEIHIGSTRVRSGRLPLRTYFQSFNGWELSTLRWHEIVENSDEIRLKLRAEMRPLEVKLLRDHSFDPIHETEDWNEIPRIEAALDLVLKLARDEFDGVRFEGFSYHYEYSCPDAPLFYILDKASWELDGDITGASVASQSSCSSPSVYFECETAWTTEGVLHFEDAASMANMTMTHNLPRWASHQAFDFQWKGASTLVGVFERVELIRSLLKREAGKSELKTFDKHIFDQAAKYSTSPKKILLNADAKTETDQKNLWTRVFDEVHRRARDEFGLQEEVLVPRLCWDYWQNFSIDDYFSDLLPVAQNLGFKALFVDNLNKSAMTEKCPHPDRFWNMCVPHEWEVAPQLGGNADLKKFVAACGQNEIAVFAWTNNNQSLTSPLNLHDADARGWYLKMEDTRTKYGGAYTNVLSSLDFKHAAPRELWIESLKKIKAATGLSGYLFDSFYNLGWMPVNYNGGVPSTQWRELLGAFKELQDADIHFLIESFGPFGSPQHGCPAAYGARENLFAAYKLAVGLGYSTIPTGEGAQAVDEAETIYRFFAHMTSPSFSLFENGVRLDRKWSARHKQALADYHANTPFMHKRFLQEDGQGVLWHNGHGTRATLWNFVARRVLLPGKICDETAAQAIAPAAFYDLEPLHTYSITASTLPIAIHSVSEGTP